MRLFKLINLQHVAGFLFPALIFIILLGVALGFYHFKQGNITSDNPDDLHTFADGIKKGNGPFPLILILTIIGTVIWAIIYILMYGLSEVKL